MKIFTLAFALLLVCCNPVKSGKVVEKIYKPAWTETGVNMVTVSYDPVITVPVPYTRHHPERFCLRLEGEVKGKTKEGIVDVPAATWNDVEVGELYGVETGE